MRKANFSLVVMRTSQGFGYQYGFKSSEDAEKFTEMFGGVAEHVNCVFYDNLEDAINHQDKIKNAKEVLSSISQDEAIRHLIMSDPEIISKIKSLNI